MWSHLADVARAVDRAAARRGGTGPERLADVLAVLAADYRLGADGGAADVVPEEGDGGATSPDALAVLADVFELDELEQLLVAIAAAPDLDANLGIALELLADGAASGARHVTLGIALELCGIGTAEATGRELLSVTAPLRRHRLVELVGDGPWLSRSLRVPDRVVSHLAGDSTLDPVVAELLVRTESVTTPETETVARALDRGSRLVYVRSALGAPGAAVAAGAFGRLGVRVLAVDLARRPAGLDAADALALATREAGLQRAGLVVLGVDGAIAPGGGAGGEGPARPDRTVVTVLERAAVPVVALGHRGWDPSWSRDLPLSVDATRLPVDGRREVWARALPDVDLAGAGSGSGQGGGWGDVVTLRLDPLEVATTVRYARMLAAVRDEELSPDLVREAARRLSSGSNGKVVPGRTAASIGDLVLPDLQRRQVEQLIGWAQHRDVVLAQGALNGPGGKGTGLSALLSGGPGTGKTLAAHVVADALGLDLYPVDLSAIVDKYVGETEKNLERVFHEAESLNVVLFFDEADSLFGSRSEVKDSRDRYANIEVAYLLQRMEQFDGIVILATNLQANLDPAFSRRLDFIIHFPDPDEPTRRLLWRTHLDRLAAMDDGDPVRVDEVAAAVELAGGHVRNIVMAAAYDAAAAGRPVGMALVADAVRREYAKIGRRAPGVVATWPTARESAG